jgi:potassium intermediate/small conductance calcium-activated channel subfamily N protein 3
MQHPGDGPTHTTLLPGERHTSPSSRGVCSVVEDPGIPLVGRNGGFQMYTQDSLERPPGKYDNVGYRLAKRKELFQRRKIVCDLALAFALIGIILMVIETELFMNRVYTKDELPSLLIKLCITISTVTLLGFVMWYHILDIKLFMCDNSLEDWRLAISWKRVVKIALELAVYAIHPIPGHFDFEWTTFNAMTQEISTTKVPVDVIFSIPMFLRLFLLCRVIMLNSKLFTDASSQSLGALNRIHFNFKFIFKSMMTLYPEYVLTVLMLSSFIISSWLLRACEMYHDERHASFLNSMWLIAITFLSVGYGDIVPNSYCGRGIAVLTGIFGAGCTALVVAVLARKLELSRAEKYVHNFVIDVELDKRYKVAAANILKAGWFVYKNKKLGKMTVVRRYQRKLLKAIHSIRDVKQEQRRLVDSGVTMVEMFKAQNRVNELIDRVETNQLHLGQRVTKIENTLVTMDEKLNQIVSILKH